MAKLKILIIGAGNRGNSYAHITEDLEEEITGIVDIDKKKRDDFANRFNISKEMIWGDYKKALDSNHVFNAVYITTPDQEHYKIAIYALKKGYHVLLEKPMATTAIQCVNIIKKQKESKKLLSICHGLRYSAFFQKIKNIVKSEELGKIRQIKLKETIGYWHFAHSYVRGNWADEKKSSPLILAKSCHDLDILSWLIDSPAKNVFSKGSLKFFKEENAPVSSKVKCVDCPIGDCIYDAKRFYLNQKENNIWPYNVISPLNTTEAGRLKAIKETKYGRCVFKCDNNVCDYQDVLIEYENGVDANFTISSGGERSSRNISIQFEDGEINGDLQEGILIKIKYNGRRKEGEEEVFNIGEKGGHGGGDEILIKNFIELVKSKNRISNLTSAEESLSSHLLSFAAEKSRKAGKMGMPVDFVKFKKDLLL